MFRKNGSNLKQLTNPNKEKKNIIAKAKGLSDNSTYSNNSVLVEGLYYRVDNEKNSPFGFYDDNKSPVVEVLYNHLEFNFSKYGNVLWIFINPFKNIDPHAVVTFDNENSAQMLLNETKNGNLEYTVAGLKLLKIQKNISDNFPILKLNEQCLIEIFKYLPLFCQVKLIVFSENFREILKKFYKQTKEITINRCDFSNPNDYQYWKLLWDVLKLIENDIEKINFEYQNCYDPSFEGLIKAIIHYCSKPKSIKLIHRKIKTNYQYVLKNKKFFSYLKSCTTLQELSLVNFSGGYELNDTDLEKMSALKSLEILDLSDNYLITGYKLKLTDISTLILRNCIGIKEKHLIEILLNSKNLQILDITNCVAVDGDFYEKLINICDNLKVLKFSIGSVVPKQLHSLNKLKYLKEIFIDNRNTEIRAVKDNFLDLLETISSCNNIENICIGETIKLKATAFLVVAMCLQKRHEEMESNKKFKLKIGVRYIDERDNNIKKDARYMYLKNNLKFHGNDAIEYFYK